MNYKIIVDILDNNQISKDISLGLYNKLKNNNYDTLLLDNNLTIKEKINEIIDMEQILLLFQIS